MRRNREFRVVISGFNNQTGDGVLRWTSDGGASWSSDVVLSGDNHPVRWLDRIAFIDASNGIAMAPWSQVSHRTDSGGGTPSDWTGVQVSQDSWFGGNFTYAPDGSVWVSGISFCQSSDYGVTWQCRPSIDSVFDGGGVSFPDSLNGWVAGGTISPEVRGWVHRTNDGGVTWSGGILDAPFPIRSVLFLDQNIGFAAGGNIYSGVWGIYSTIDGGETWRLDLNTGAEMRSINIVRSSDTSVDVWCAGYDGAFVGKIYKTSVNF
jgi:hypothetical protein